MARASDQPGRLGQRNELVRGDQAAAGMLPACERLGAEQPATTVHLRLVVKYELAFLYAATQIALEYRAGGDRGLHLRIEESQSVAAD